jgi:hypothetical protein
MVCFAFVNPLKFASTKNVRMKNSLKFAALILVAVIAVACSGNGGPEGSAKSYLEAYNAKEFDKAKEFATEDTKGMLDFMKNIAAMGGEKKDPTEKKEVKNIKCTVEGDSTAICTYCCNEQGAEDKISLKKVGDKWLVHQPKENNPMGGEGSGEQMMEGATDSTSAPVIEPASGSTPAEKK